MRHLILLATIGILSTLPAIAQIDSTSDDLRRHSITISPYHVVSPIIEITGEYKVAPKTGMAAIVGFGSVDVTVYEGNLNWSHHTLTAFELGASLRYYLIGDFDHGMQIGAEMLYAHVAGTFDRYEAEGVGSGLAFGPFVGYKVAFGFGLTLELQGGAQYLISRARASSLTSDQGAVVTDGEIVPLVNANIGWTF